MGWPGAFRGFGLDQRDHIDPLGGRQVSKMLGSQLLHNDPLTKRVRSKSIATSSSFLFIEKVFAGTTVLENRCSHHGASLGFPTEIPRPEPVGVRPKCPAWVRLAATVLGGVGVLWTVV